MTQLTQHSGATDLSSDPVRWRILVVLLIAIFMSLMSVSVVNVALASIQDGLNASQSDIQWVLSGYALTTRKDFSFMGGFLLVGVLLAFFAGLAAVFFEIPALSLTVSAAFVLLMSGLILYETSNIIHGGETNYVMATVSLYVTIFNLFTSLLQLLGFANSSD